MVRKTKPIAETTAKPPSTRELASLLGNAYEAFRALADRVYPEGRPVSVTVRQLKDLAKVEELVAVKLSATGRSGSTAGDD